MDTSLRAYLSPLSEVFLLESFENCYMNTRNFARVVELLWPETIRSVVDE